MAGGRPTVIDDAILSKLEYAFVNSFTDDEACLYADISPATLYRYIENNPEFGERKEMLKKKPNIKAKLNWIKKLEGEDYIASKEWLERKSRGEFSMKMETENKNDNTNVDVSSELSPEQKQAIAKRWIS